MPDLRKVLPERFFDGDADTAPEAAALLDVAVTQVRLNTGSPCDGHAAMFETWPGPEPHVRQWFRLANGNIVAVNEDPDGPWTYPVRDDRGHRAA